jgi:high-affinity Fe2+/Pb2+ permease
MIFVTVFCSCLFLLGVILFLGGTAVAYEAEEYGMMFVYLFAAMLLISLGMYTAIKVHDRVDNIDHITVIQR